MKSGIHHIVHLLSRLGRLLPSPSHPFFGFVQALSLFFPGLLFLMVYARFIAFDAIGQDLLMQAGEWRGPAMAAFTGLLCWMFFNWRSSRRVSNKYLLRYTTRVSLLYKHLPRWMSYQAAVALQLGILFLPTISFDYKNSLLVVYWLVSNCLYITLHHHFEHQHRRAGITSRILIAFKLIFWGAIISMAPGHVFSYADAGRHRVMLPLLAMLSFALQVFFVRFAIYWHGVTAADDKPVKKLRRFLQFNLVAAIPLAGFTCIVAFPTAAEYAGPLACTLITISLWVGFICLMQYIGLHFRFDTIFVLIPLAILWGTLYSSRYDVPLPVRNNNYLYHQRPSLDEYLEKWLSHPARKKRIDQSEPANPFPIYLVIAEGGASKSGYWVSSILSKLEEQTVADQFSDHLLSLAGSSGGSVGNAAFYSLLRHKHVDKYSPNNQSTSFSEETDNFFRSDFLTFSLARFLGIDLFKHVVPLFFINDRATALATGMEQLPSRPIIKTSFSEPVENVFDSSGRLPLLFINTTHLQTGHPCLISKVRYDSNFSARWDVLNLVDDQQAGGRHRLMKLSTAAVLGARFPYISPAGGIGAHFFVDGGYFDNSGAGITLELLEYLNRKLSDSSHFLFALRHRVRFKVLYMSNEKKSSPYQPPKEQNNVKLNPLLNDLAAPVITILGTYSKQTGLNNLKLEKYMQQNEYRWGNKGFMQINLPLKVGDSLDYPTNWVISDFHLDRIRQNIALIRADSVLYK